MRINVQFFIIFYIQLKSLIGKNERKIDNRGNSFELNCYSNFMIQIEEGPVYPIESQCDLHYNYVKEYFALRCNFKEKCSIKRKSVHFIKNCTRFNGNIVYTCIKKVMVAIYPIMNTAYLLGCPNHTTLKINYLWISFYKYFVKTLLNQISKELLENVKNSIKNIEKLLIEQCNGKTICKFKDLKLIRRCPIIKILHECIPSTSETTIVNNQATLSTINGEQTSYSTSHGIYTSTTERTVNSEFSTTDNEEGTTASVTYSTKHQQSSPIGKISTTYSQKSQLLNKEEEEKRITNMPSKAIGTFQTTTEDSNKTMHNSSRFTAKESTMAWINTDKPILEIKCLEEYSGIFHWKQTNVTNFEEEVLVSSLCPDGENNATRICSYNNQGWLRMNTSNCQSSEMLEIDQEPKSQENLTNTANKISKLTQTGRLYAGDISLTGKILQVLSKNIENVTFTQAENITKAITQSVSNLLKPDKLLVWEELSQTTRHQTALRMITSIEETTMKISDSISLQRNNTDSLLIEEENVVVSIQKLNNSTRQSNTEFIFTSSIGRQSAFGRSEDGEEDSTNSRNEFIIPRKAIGGLVNDESVLIFIEYSNMEDVLLNNKRIVEEETWRGEMNETLTIRGKKTVESESRKGKRVFNSKVIAAILSTNSVKQSALESDVFLIVERKDKSLVGNTECSFWNTTSTDKNKEGVWSNHGCFMMKEESNKTHVKCRCNHLTNFAILMDIHGVDKSLSEIDRFALMIITRCGCCVSIFFLMITIIIFAKFRRKFYGKVTKEATFLININLSISLLLAQVIFSIGIPQTSNKIICHVVTTVLLYFLLACFMWMGLYGILSLIMVIFVYEPKSSLRWKFLSVGYGIPILISIDVVKDFFLELKEKTYCWIDKKHFIYCFILPLCLVIFINLIASIVICIKYRRSTA
ncbi:DgyrCDS10454, partial [Dimorphilus gyrociliatus]